MSTLKHNWTKDEIIAIYNKPLMDLLFEAASVHREFHDPNVVQVSTLLSIKTGGCSEFIEADAGIVVPYLNTNEMAIKIIDLYKNQILAQQLGNNAKEKVLKKYSFENSVIKIEELLSFIPHI